MKQLLTLTLILTMGLFSQVKAQLPPGAIAPDFTLTDIEGNTHNLYDYLAQGKMVVLEFSATWCGPCWNYMLSGALETFWEEHGPDGDNTAMVFYIEADQATGMDDLLGLTGSSQGNWVEAIPFPIIDLQVGENTDVQYQIAYYPTLYATCSDQTVWELGQVPAQTWANFITSCTLEGETDFIAEATCYGDGGVELNYSGGYEPVTFEWSNGDETQNLENVGAGVYSVTITEFYDKFTIIDNIVVPGAEEPVALQESSIEEPLCNGSSNGSIIVTYGGGTPGYEYAWSNGGNTQVLANVPAGDYTLTVTDDNGCTDVESFAIEEPEPLEAELETTTENCEQENGTATLLISGGVGNYEISSSSGEVFGNQIINLPQGIHTATVEDANGCIWEESFEIEHLDAPTVDLAQGADLTCIQLTTSVTGFAAGGTGDYEYQWSTQDGHIVSGSINQTAIVDAEGTYTLVVTDFYSGCEVESSIEVVAEIVLPEVDAGTDLPVTCELQEITLQGSGDPLNTITWSTADGNIVSGGDTYTPLVNEPGTYTIHVTNSATGCSTTDEVVVNNNEDPAQAAYQYQTSSLTVMTTNTSTGSNLTGWNWSFGDGNTSTEVSPVHTYAADGTYEVCLSVQNGCGQSTTCLSVTVNFDGSAITVLGDVTPVLCNGGNSGAIGITVNGGSGNYTYLWSGPNGNSFNSEDIDQLIAGTYTVLITDDQGNSIVHEFTVPEPDALAIGASTVTDNLCNGVHIGSILIEMAGGVAPYQYSWNGGPFQSDNFINQLAGGVYECMVNDANGCPILVGPYTINEPPVIGVQVTEVNDVTNESLNNGSISIEVSGGVGPYQITWSNGMTGASIQDLAPGEYTYQITDANGCVYQSAAPIVINNSVATVEPDASKYVSITPNPSDGRVQVKWNDIVATDATLTLLTIDGRILATHSISAGNGTWDLTGMTLSEGLYVVMLKQNDTISPIKLVIM